MNHSMNFHHHILFKVALLASCIVSTSFVEGVEVFNPSKFPFVDVMDTSDIPQFVTITFDGDVTPPVAGLFRKLIDIRHRNGCGIKSTFFVSFQNTADPTLGGGRGDGECQLIQGLLKGQHEIGTNTYNRSTTSEPSVTEIEAAMNHLSEQCHIPPADLRGFRSPTLQYSQDTLDRINDLGLLYDSTLTPIDHEESGYGFNHTWPFTFTNQSSLDEFHCRGCDSTTTLQANPGLWEIPMTPIYNPDNTVNLPMDYSPYYDNDITSILQYNLERHYLGNRAPLGLNFHGSWLSANGDEFRNWVNETLNRYDDVYFVTNHELIEWMRDPTPKYVYQPTCEDQIVDCLPPEQSCVFGDFNSESCECDCFIPYCKDTYGSCSRICNEGEANTNQFTEFDGHCCPNGHNGFLPYEDCRKYYWCVVGQVREVPQPEPVPPVPTYMCPEGMLFDSIHGACNWADNVTCTINVEDADQCGSLQETPSPTGTPTMSFSPTGTPSSVPTGTPTITFEPSLVPTQAPIYDYEAAEAYLEEEDGIDKMILLIGLGLAGLLFIICVVLFYWHEQVKKSLICVAKSIYQCFFGFLKDVY